MPPREAFHIGPFHIGNFTVDIPVYWYGIMIMLGVIVASFFSYREARRRGEDPEHVWQMFPWVLIAGIVGARGCPRAGPIVVLCGTGLRAGAASPGRAMPRAWS